MIKNLELSLSGDTFAGLKADFDVMLNSTLCQMEERKCDEATITAKVKITLTPGTAPDLQIVAYHATREIIKPKFEHNVSTVIAVKAEQKGIMAGEYEMVFDHKLGKFVLRPLSNGQMSFDDLEEGGTATVDENGVVQDVKFPESYDYACCHCGLVSACANAHKLTGEAMKELNGLCGVVDGVPGLPYEPVEDEEPDEESGGLFDERKCRVCGCTDSRACIVNGEPCFWVEDDLCSACATPEQIESALAMAEDGDHEESEDTKDER